jgi:hypothetical protein
MMASYRLNRDSFVADKPRLWSDTQLVSRPVGQNGYMDLAPDGKRFAVLMPLQESGQQGAPTEVTFLLNFFDELRRKVPAGK